MDQAETSLDDVIFIAGSTDQGRSAACGAVRRALPAVASGKLQLQRVIHATLVLAGAAADPRTIPVALETASFIRVPRFELVFDTLVGFGGPKGVLALACSRKSLEWSALRKQLSQVPRRLGTRAEGGSSPHLTVGYGFAETRPLALSDPVVWTIEEFVLVQSLHRQSDHAELGRWRLG